MVEILQNKNAATRFQIMVEIAAGTGVNQRAIAANLGLTPQAISDYVHQLLDEGLLAAMGRSSYKVTAKGVDWMLKTLRQLNDYVSVVQRAVTNIATCAAIAEDDIQKGQTVGVMMKHGLLYATRGAQAGAQGTAMSNARAGEDIDVSGIHGLVEFTRGRVTILQVPGIQRGGSKQTDQTRLRALIIRPEQTGTIGIEALTALRRAGIEPRYLYGVGDATVEGVNCGLSFTVVCSEEAVSGLAKRLQQEEIIYEVIDVATKSG